MSGTAVTPHDELSSDLASSNGTVLDSASAMFLFSISSFFTFAACCAATDKTCKWLLGLPKVKWLQLTDKEGKSTSFWCQFSQDFTHQKYLNQLISDRVIRKLKRWTFFETQCRYITVPKTETDSQMYNHHHITTILRPFFWDHWGEPVPEESFSWTLWC